jgi:hypothetical protein
VECSELNKHGPGTGFSEHWPINNPRLAEMKGTFLTTRAAFIFSQRTASWKNFIVYFVSTLFLLKFRNWFQKRVRTDVIIQEQTCRYDLTVMTGTERQHLVNCMM